MPIAQQTSFSSGEIDPKLHARTDLGQYTSGLAAARNVFVRVTGGVANRAGTRLIELAPEWVTHTRLIPFVFNAEQAYILAFMAGGEEQTLFWVLADGGNVLYASGENEGLPVGVAVDYAPEILSQLRYVQSADTLTVTHPSYPVTKIVRWAHDDWRVSAVNFATTVPTPSSLSLVKVGVEVGTTWKYKATYESTGGEESLPTAAVTGTNANALDNTTNYFNISVTYPYPADVKYANIYKLRNGTYGYIGSTTDGTFKDDGIAAALTETPPSARNPFAAIGNYPTACAYFQQRLALAGTAIEPAGAWLSKTGAYTNFTTSEPLQANDAITLTLSEFNLVRHMVSLRSLLMMTASSIWRLDRGDRGLTPAMEGGVQQQAAFGCSNVRPIVAGTKVLLLEANDARVRDLEFDFGSDAFKGDEISILSDHLVRGGIVDWALARWPNSLVWCVRTDGGLLSLTYLPEQKILAWTRHDSDGRFLAVATIPEGTVESPYLACRRLINGEWRICFERMARRDVTDIGAAFHVDCGLSYDVPLPIVSTRPTEDGDEGLPVTVTAHGLATDDLVLVNGLDGLPTGEKPTLARLLNGRVFRIVAVDADTIALLDRDTGLPIDATGYPPWSGGGIVRKLVSRVSGLDHLLGRQLIGLADGNVIGPLMAASPGNVTSYGEAQTIVYTRPNEADEAGLPMAVTAHGLTTGDLVQVNDIFDTGQSTSLAKILNGQTFKVDVYDADNIRLQDKDTEEPILWPPGMLWVGGGTVRKVITTALPARVELPYPAARVHIGIPYTCDVETLALAVEPELYGRKKRVTGAQVYLDRSRDIWIGPSFDDLSEMKARESEPWGSPAALISGRIEQTITATWAIEGKLCIRHQAPLPLEVLSILPMYEVGG